MPYGVQLITLPLTLTLVACAVLYRFYELRKEELMVVTCVNVEAKPNETFRTILVRISLLSLSIFLWCTTTCTLFV